MLCYFCHMGFVFVWSVFFLIALKLTQFSLEEAKKYFSYSLYASIFVVIAGVKLIMKNPYVFKSGGWFHLKLTIVIFLILENLYFYFKTKKVKEWVVFVNLGAFLLILALTFLRPF